MNLPVERKMFIRNKKCRKSTAVTRLFVVLTVSLLLLDNTYSLTEGRDICSTDNSDDICQTPGCIHSASAILKNIDPDVDPCEDFYRYACGGFINNTILSNSESSVNPFVIEDKQISKQIKLILEAKIEPDEPRHFKLAKNFYKLCMNKTAIEAIGFDFLHAQLDEMGGWPVLLGDAWNENEFVWTELVYKLRDAGYDYDNIINFSITPDSKNTTRRVIDIDQALLGLDQELFIEGFNNSIVDAYYSYMVDIAVMLGANRPNALTELEASLDFEIKLAQISLPPEERRDQTKLYNPMTLSELSKKYPSIPWREYLSRMLPSSITIEDDELVIVESPSYFTKLEKLMNSTPKRVQANYLLWKAVGGKIRFLHDAALNRRQQFIASIDGTTERLSRRDECTITVESRFSIVVAAMYVKHYFKEEAKKNAVAMVTDIRSQLNNILSHIDWMANETRREALNKASAMISNIAYPDELLDDEKVEKLYENVTVTGYNYLENVLSQNKFETDWRLGRLREPENKTDWITYADAAVVNAYYLPQLNSINFPAGILRGVFFDNDRPNYMNYGAIGFFIAHELTHGFDDTGRRFDAEGKLRNWWDPSTEEKFHQRAQCIIEQYGNYTVPEVNLTLNGINTQGENIADNGGIKIAYLAYKNWVKRNKPEKMLPGIDRTPEQMFWLSAASGWCSKTTLEALHSDVISEVHSPNEFRILGSFSNMPEFAEDYKCAKGSRMNPEKKCSVW